MQESYLVLSLDRKYRKDQEKSDSFVKIRLRPTLQSPDFGDNRPSGCDDFSENKAPAG
jgi:hypothetical protein